MERLLKNDDHSNSRQMIWHWFSIRSSVLPTVGFFWMDSPAAGKSGLRIEMTFRDRHPTPNSDCVSTNGVAELLKTGTASEVGENDISVPGRFPVGSNSRL